MILVLGADVVLHTAFLAIPYNIIANQFPANGLINDGQELVHPYASSVLLLVAVTTLVLFFASGMYSEKVAYANQYVSSSKDVFSQLSRPRYVPRANKTLRAFNMHLNVRQPPLHSKLPRLLTNPLSILFDRSGSNGRFTPSPSPTPTPTPTSTPAPAEDLTLTTKRAMSTGTEDSSNSITGSSHINSGSFVPLTSMPPTTSPRGELIFSSRVDRSFRDSYEKFRESMDKKRLAKEAATASRWWRYAPWHTPKVPDSSRPHLTSSTHGQRKSSPGVPTLVDNSSKQ